MSGSALRHPLVAVRLHNDSHRALNAAALGRVEQDPVQYPFRGSGRPMEVMERGPHAAATAGTVPTAR